MGLTILYSEVTRVRVRQCLRNVGIVTQISWPFYPELLMQLVWVEPKNVILDKRGGL